MIQTLISMFGIAIVYRNLSLLEKFEVISRRKMLFAFVILQIPIYLFTFFKDQKLFVITCISYIGLFLITLIFYRKILFYIALSTYEKCHLRILSHLILLLRSGKSAQASLKIVLNTFDPWERIVFQELESVFEIENLARKNILIVNSWYFSEMKLILKANHQVIEQLTSFREGLKIRNNLRHKSRQVTQQIRAQAVVAVFIFLVLIVVGFQHLNLRASLDLLAIAGVLFTVGLAFIFLLGGTIRWKT